MYKIVYTEGADEDRENIKKYLADKNSQDVIDKIIITIVRNARHLQQYPLMYSNYREKKTYHQMPLYNGVFKVIYQVIEDKKIVSIYGIYHHTQEINPDTLKEIRLFI